MGNGGCRLRATKDGQTAQRRLRKRDDSGVQEESGFAVVSMQGRALSVW